MGRTGHCASHGVSMSRLIDYYSRRELFLEVPQPQDFGWSESVAGMVVADDNKLMAVSGVSDDVYMWDVVARSVLHTFSPQTGHHLEGIYGMDFHATYPYFAFTERDGPVTIMRTDS